MVRVKTTSVSSARIPFPELAGRLRLTQREIKLLLAIDRGAAVVVPHPEGDRSRLETVTAALSDILLLVGDDELVGRWLRAPTARRGKTSPLEEVAWAEGDRQIAFVAPTTWKGETVGRLVFLHPLTTPSIVDEVLATLR